MQIASLGKSFQLEGELRIYPIGAAEAAALPALLEAGATVVVETAGSQRIAALRAHGSDTLIRFAGVRRVEAAQELRNARVWADPADLPAPPAGRAYLDALLGADVVAAAGAAEGAADAEALGTVVEVWPGAQDLLHVRVAGGGRRMIPLQAPYVRTEAASDGSVRVVLDDPPAGLLDG